MSHKKPASKKVRVAFRKNRVARPRGGDLTKQYDPNAAESSSSLDEAPNAERLSGRGEITRKRTIIGEMIPVDHSTGQRGDFVVRTKLPRETISGRVTAVHGLYSTVETEDARRFTCVTRRVLKTLATDQRQVVVTGDRVMFRDAHNAGQNEGIIERVEPRAGSISRTSRGRKHLLVTNVDQAVLVASVAEPNLKPNLIDRLLVTCDRSQVRPILCLNKIDLVDPASLMPFVGLYAQLGYRVLMTSVQTGRGIDRLRRLLADNQSVVVGQSGVGKSSLLNAIDPSLDRRIAAVSEETQKGKHTTTTAELIRWSFGGWVVDTPGIRQFSLWDLIPEEVIGFYRDLRPYENLCRYPDCTHTHENLCAVKDAVADGRLDPRRYESYLALRAGEMESSSDYSRLT